MNKMLAWAMVFLTISGIVYVVSDTLAPFLISFIFAYLLQPAIDTNCKKFSLPRGIVTFGVFSLFLSGFVTIIVLIAPIIYRQISTFISKIPIYKTNFDSAISAWSTKFYDIDPDLANKISDSAQNVVNGTLTLFASFANHLWQYTVATLNFFTVVALIPIILYYFLRDWPHIVKTVDSIFPMKSKNKVREIFNSINELLSAYIRGQLNICMLLTIYYVTGLSIIGLDISLLLGIFSGFLIIIPFIGVVLSFLMVTISCYFSFGAGTELIYVLILFAIGYTVESYILTPKIIGDRIGLHPVWIIFSVFATANLFGFVGVLFAIPIAGIAKVCLLNIIDYYKSSSMYKS